MSVVEWERAFESDKLAVPTTRLQQVIVQLESGAGDCSALTEYALEHRNVSQWVVPGQSWLEVKAKFTNNNAALPAGAGPANFPFFRDARIIANGVVLENIQFCQQTWSAMNMVTCASREELETKLSGVFAADFGNPDDPLLATAAAATAASRVATFEWVDAGPTYTSTYNIQGVNTTYGPNNAANAATTVNKILEGGFPVQLLGRAKRNAIYAVSSGAYMSFAIPVECLFGFAKAAGARPFIGSQFRLEFTRNNGLDGIVADGTASFADATAMVVGDIKWHLPVAVPSVEIAAMLQQRLASRAVASMIAPIVRTYRSGLITSTDTSATLKMALNAPPRFLLLGYQASSQLGVATGNAAAFGNHGFRTISATLNGIQYPPVALSMQARKRPNHITWPSTGGSHAGATTDLARAFVLLQTFDGDGCAVDFGELGGCYQLVGIDLSHREPQSFDPRSAFDLQIDITRDAAASNGYLYAFVSTLQEYRLQASENAIQILMGV